MFFPQLRYEAFLQEGYRLEITPELTHNGVVFNEMKGAMSSSASIEHFEVSKHLFPEGHQQYNSGGQPDSIKNITHADILAFHKKHYRPANAIFTSYGHLPPQLEQVSGLLQRYQDKNGQGQGATEGQTCVVQGNEYIDASAAAAMSTAASFTEPKMIKVSTRACVS